MNTPEIADLPKHRNEAERILQFVGTYGTLVTLGFALLTFLVTKHFASRSPFVNSCPTQYGEYILGILYAGVAASFLGHIFFLLEVISHMPKFGIRGATTIAITAVALIALGIEATGTWLQSNFDAHPGYGDAPVLLFSFLTLLNATLLWQKSKDCSLGIRVFGVELPLFISLLAVIAGKALVFSESSESFNTWVTNLEYYPTGRPHGWESLSQQIKGDLRAAFWSGILTGVIGVQLLVAQVASAGLGRLTAEFTEKSES